MSNLRENIIPESACPACGYLMDRATSVEAANGGAAVPTVGSLSLCVMCAEFLEFGTDMRLKRLEQSIYLSLPKETMRMMAKARELILTRGAEFREGSK